MRSPAMWSSVISMFQKGLKKLGYQIDTPEDHHCHSMLVVAEKKEEMADYFQQKGIFFTAEQGIMSALQWHPLPQRRT